MLMPGRAKNMGDGWETKRRRGPGHDWAIVRLGAPGLLTKIEIDTNHFKGNFPDAASIEASVDGEKWTDLLPRTRDLNLLPLPLSHDQHGRPDQPPTGLPHGDFVPLTFVVRGTVTGPRRR